MSIICFLGGYLRACGVNTAEFLWDWPVLLYFEPVIRGQLGKKAVKQDFCAQHSWVFL